MMIAGKPIFVSPMMPTPGGPKVRLATRRWHKFAPGYATRVQKKLLKRFGQGFFCSAGFYDRLLRRL